MILVLVILLIFVGYLVYLSTDTTVRNPPKNYWMWRKDGTGVQAFKQNGIYLTQTITQPDSAGACDSSGNCPSGIVGTCYAGQCLPYCNAEIYNNPCCGDIQSACKLRVNEIQSLISACPQLLQKMKSTDPYYLIVEALCSYGQANSGNIVEITNQFCSILSSICKSEGCVSSDFKCNLVPNLLPIDNSTDVIQSIKDMFFNVPYLYSTFTCTAKAVNVNGGSRGWGFWNTRGDMNIQCAWFMQQNGVCPENSPFGAICPPSQPYPLNGMYAMIIVGNGSSTPQMKMVKLNDLDENWHDYKIDWGNNKVDFYMDNVLVLSEPTVVPNTNMAIHVWVDNAVFVSGNNIFEHIVQNIQNPRINYIKKLSIS